MLDTWFAGGRLRDVEAAGDLGVAFSSGDAVVDLGLAFGQLPGRPLRTARSMIALEADHPLGGQGASAVPATSVARLT